MSREAVMKIRMRFAGVLMAAMISAITVFAVKRANASDLLPFQNPALPIDQRVDDLVNRLSLEEKVTLINADAKAVPRLGIKKYEYGHEALHGITGPGNFTVFPMAIAIASTWDPSLVTQITTAISDEAWGAINRDRPKNGYPGLMFLTFWSPTINMARDPRWGRTPETYGEDPWLTSRIAVAFVKGLQGNDPKYIKVVSTPKHYAANNEEHNRFRCNAVISERTLREYYLPGFEATVKEANAQSVMSAYNAVNGIPCSANKFLLTDILRNEWDFNGYVVTDCGAPNFLISQHKYAKNGAEAAADAVNAGVDIECGGENILPDNMINAIAQNLTTEKQLNQAIRHLMTVRMRLGMFDPPEMNPYSRISPSVIGSKEHAELARQTSRESIVLLKNEKQNGAALLPLDTTRIKSIAVVGPNSSVVTFGDYSGTPVHVPVTPFEGIRNRAGNIKVNHTQWMDIPKELDYVLAPADLFSSGVKTEYFQNVKFEGQPVLTRTESAIDLSGLSTPDNPSLKTGPMSVRWTGRIVPSESGIHFFSVRATGDARLAINGDVLIDKAAVVQKKKPAIVPGKPMDSFLLDSQVKKRLIAAAMLQAGQPYDITVEYSVAKGEPFARLEWAPPSGDVAKLRADEMEIVKKSDVVVAVMGYFRINEHENIDRVSLDIPEGQTEYVRALMKVNPNVIVVLVNGSPISINWIARNAPSIVEAWYPGEQGGNAIADVLFGDYNPAGRLPFTFYSSVDDLPPFDDYEVSRGRTYMYFTGTPIYQFGYGLSYTTFEYSGLKIDRKSAGAADTVNVSFDLKNVGDRDGDEVAQLYIHDVQSSVKQPMKQLKGFQRVHLKKGETQHVTIPLAVGKLSFFDQGSKKFIVEPGAFDILVGASSSDIRLKDTINVTQ